MINHCIIVSIFRLGVEVTESDTRGSYCLTSTPCIFVLVVLLNLQNSRSRNNEEPTTSPHFNSSLVPVAPLKDRVSVSVSKNTLVPVGALGTEVPDLFGTLS